ncbi:PAS domain-containing protein [bacterium]|nr:PAS domain-containing protein [bacterium]
MTDCLYVVVDRLLNARPNPAWRADRQGRRLFFNSTWIETFGDRRADIGAEGWLDSVHPEDLQRVTNTLAESARSGSASQVEYRLRNLSGKYVWLLESAGPLLDGRGALVGFFGTCANISRRKTAENSLREKTVELNTLYDIINLSPVVAFRWSTLPGWPILYVSPNVSRFGYKASKLVSAGFNYGRLIHPDDLEKARKDVEYYTARKKDTFTQEYRFLLADGSFIWVEDRTLVKRDSSGEIEQYQGIVFDISERRNLEEQLLHAQRLDSVGRLAAGVAHDFNNMLSPILGYSEILLDSLADPSPEREDIRLIHEAAEKSSRLTQQLLAFGRKQMLEVGPVDINLLIGNFEQLLRRMLREDIRIRLDLKADIGKVLADPGKIEQVLMNLAINARDAMPQGGQLTIETSLARLDEAYIRRKIGVDAGEYVLLAVSDTGCGISREMQDRIFEPFFTTKSEGKGTGLGLSVVYGIVRQHGGHLSVYSEPGLGTTMKVFLPRLSVKSPLPVAENPHQELKTAFVGGTVLLVEDEEAVRELVRKVLEKYGYCVLTAGNVSEAVQLAREHPAAIDLLVTDVIMPEMNGKEVYHAVSAYKPGCRVLYMSGYTENIIADHGILREGINFISKPFSVRSLLEKVRKTLQ